MPPAATAVPALAVFNAILQWQLQTKQYVPKMLYISQDIERAYNHNPYHNNIHAADVTQTLGCFLANDQFAQKLTDLEIASMIFATCIHDVGHPGLLLTPITNLLPFLL